MIDGHRLHRRRLDEKARRKLGSGEKIQGGIPGQNTITAFLHTGGVLFPKKVKEMFKSFVCAYIHTTEGGYI